MRALIVLALILAGVVYSDTNIVVRSKSNNVTLSFTELNKKDIRENCYLFFIYCPRKDSAYIKNIVKYYRRTYPDVEWMKVFVFSNKSKAGIKLPLSKDNLACETAVYTFNKSTQCSKLMVGDTLIK